MASSTKVNIIFLFYPHDFEVTALKDWLLIISFLVPMILVIVSISVWTIYNGISPMPTSFKVKRSLFKVLPKKPVGKIYDLGSGWGTLVMPLGRYYVDCSIIGIESSPLPFWISRIWLAEARLIYVSLRRTDIFSVDLRDAGLVICYLYPGAMHNLRIKFEKELLPGTWVISHTFAVPKWKEVAIYQVDDMYRTKIYVYQFAY